MDMNATNTTEERYTPAYVEEMINLLTPKALKRKRSSLKDTEMKC